MTLPSVKFNRKLIHGRLQTYPTRRLRTARRSICVFRWPCSRSSRFMPRCAGRNLPGGRGRCWCAQRESW